MAGWGAIGVIQGQVKGGDSPGVPDTGVGVTGSGSVYQEFGEAVDKRPLPPDDA